ncbi:MAG: hypothetical protein NTY76_00935 [Candidatus Omnitrophica bacterium]|nr:hypothetical protein [Candidatus Omnitrophota bacterium]
MSIKSIIFVLAFVLLGALTIYPQELWTSKDGSIRNIDTRSVFVDGRKIYLATRTELYASNGPKARWESIFFIPSSDNEIACISGNSGNLFVGTRRGLFKSQDLGKTWRNVFKTIIPEKSSVLVIDIPGRNADKVMIGTERGLFISDDGGARWRDSSGILKNHRVKCIALNGGHIYAGADDGLYSTGDHSYDWQRVFVYINASDIGDTPEEASDSAEPEKAADPGINCIAFKGSKIYAASTRRILCSEDNAKSWKYLCATGLRGTVNCLLVSESSDKMYCATTKGVFEFAANENKWSELYKGMDKALNVKKIVFGEAEEKTLWAGTDKGLYKLEIGNFTENQYMDVEKNLKTMKVIFDGEPSFKELQEAAMRFNEVHPDKIKEWRTAARMRALAPKVSVGFDNSTSNNYNIVAAATVPDRDRVVVGPDDINEGFDISVSWDLANLIWSDDQTNIDVRSRLTTQLRNDILDDLRRAYFERKRLQYEIMTSPPVDMRLRFEKELRIQELTQAIDDLTGNYLSEHIKKG